MEDYEIRDVMFREQTPDIILNFLLKVTADERSLIIEAHNYGSAFAQYVAVFLDVPVQIEREIDNKMNLKDGGKMYRHRLTNLNQEYSNANFPLLRNMAISWKIPLHENFLDLLRSDLIIKFKIYADNALPKESKIFLKEIELADLRSKTDKV